MRAAEKVIAEHGMANVSIKKIVTAAGQKNESALQYHFKTLGGLLRAIHDERSAQVQAHRMTLLNDALRKTPELSLRQLCALIIEPTFDLARTNVGFRRYVKAFGHELAIRETSPLSFVRQAGGGGQSGERVGRMLAKALPHLDASALHRRMEAAVILCSASMAHQARQPNAFRSSESGLFLNTLIDALVGLLSEPVSEETARLSPRS